MNAVKLCKSLLSLLGRNSIRITGTIALALACSGAHAEVSVVDLRSHGEGPAYFISFVVLAPKSSGLEPSALTVWGDPVVAAKSGAWESVGLISAGMSASTAGAGGVTAGASYFGRLPAELARPLDWSELTGASPHSRLVTDALTLLVDEPAYRDAYEVFGGERQGTYFEDQTILPGDAAARNHGIAQIISYFAGIGSRLGQSVPDTLHLASTAGDDPTGMTANFSPQLYLRNMMATAVAQRELTVAGGDWRGDTFGQWPNGYGQFAYLSGARYVGEMHHGVRRGQGTWQSADGLIISGTFDGDEPTVAEVIFPDGDSFSGLLQDGRVVNGCYQWRNGLRYTGSFGLSEQLVDGTLSMPDGQTVKIVQGLPQPDDRAPLSFMIPRSHRLLAYAIDFSR